MYFRFRSASNSYWVQLGALLLPILFFIFAARHTRAQTIKLETKQITTGPKHHFFGYIGQCQTVPWNKSGRYIVALEIEQIDRMPRPHEAATIILIDTHHDYQIQPIESTHAWNPQQGTMLYWNPTSPQTQFFFNDRDVTSGNVYTVLYDVQQQRRVREFRYDGTPIGNGGVSQSGGSFLGLNYGRLARLRAVTGYPGALDWSSQSNAPNDDGIFLVDVETAEKRLLVSYQDLAGALRPMHPEVDQTALFINHTLWNRSGDRIYFFARGNWGKIGRGLPKINVPFSVHSDGSGLTLHQQHIGGHPEWAEQQLLIGREDENQILYDVDQQQVIGQIGSPAIFPKPEGDIALSPDGEWFVNGYKEGVANRYVVYRRSDRAWARSDGISKGHYADDIRIDPAPRWNRTNDAILVPGIAADQTRQLFVIQVSEESD